jgi:anhydro-N-acetylmuramic acid kinase
MSELNKPCVYFAIGLMSGSSLDGLDIAYCCFQKKHISPEKWDHSVIIADTVKFTEDILAPLK